VLERLEGVETVGIRRKRGKKGDIITIVDRCWGLQGAIMEGMVDPDYKSEDDPNE